jgi:hypothetical protein
VRRISPQGIVQTIAGSGRCGTVADNTPAISAELCSAGGLVFTQGELLFVGSSGPSFSAISKKVFRVDPSGTIFTIAGQTVDTPLNSSGDLGIDGARNLYLVE